MITGAFVVILNTAAALQGAAPGRAAPAVAPIAAWRGLAASVEVATTEALAPKPLQSATSPLLVRIAASASPGTVRIEYLGLVAGTYKLADYIQLADGRPAAVELPTIEIVSRLPAGTLADLKNSPPPTIATRRWYDLALGAIGLAWLGVPVALLVRRARRTRAAGVPTQAPELPPDELAVLLSRARANPLDTGERARLELVVLRRCAARVGRAMPEADDVAELAVITRDLRAHPDTRGPILALERWLHSGASTPDDPGPLDDLEPLVRRSAAPQAVA